MDDSIVIERSGGILRGVFARLPHYWAFLIVLALPRFVAAQEPAQTVRFGRRPAQVGDQVEQTILLETRLSTAWRKGNEVVERSTSTTRSRQKRLVTTTEITDGRTQGVLVRYLEAAKQLETGDAKSSAASGDAKAQAAGDAQPVAGKSYRCRREGEKLIVTDADGKFPPLAEYEIVAADMEAVGRPSPLAEFLTGRTVRVGETLALPTEVAERLLGIGEKFGKFDRFDLTLREVRQETGATCAVFQTSVAAASHDASQMRLEVDGPLVVEIESCRAVRTGLSGPIGLSESRGTHSAAYQVFGTGKLSMSIASAYRDVKR